MKNRNCWQLLSSLSGRESVRFIRWLEFELGDTCKYVQQLTRKLVEHLPDCPTEQRIWSQIYPEKAYDDARLRKLLRDTTRLLEEFLAIESFRRDQHKKDIFLLQEVHQRNRPHLFLKIYRRLERSLEKLPARNASFFRKRYEMEGIFQHYLIKYRPRERYSRTEAFTHAFNNWWMLGKMELACIHSFHSSGEGDELEQILLEEVMQYISHSKVQKDVNALQIYHNLYLLLHGRAGVEPQHILSLLKTHGGLFSFEELRTIFGLLINFHTSKYNRTNSALQYKELFLLYEWGIQEKLIFQDNLINLNHYKNIQSICLRLKKFDKAAYYLKLFKSHLPKGIGEEAYAFNHSTYLFAVRDFVGVIELLRTTKFHNLMYEIPARALLIQAHYEQSGHGQEWLLTQVNSLSRFIRQQKIPSNHKKAYLNFLTIMAKLTKILMPFEIRKLSSKITQTNPLYQGHWLNQKISERLDTKSF
ncbi:MAG: hypothetical protein AAF587_08295 [Bacteroidota bacterium]